MNRQRLRIAVQKSGRLSQAGMDLLERCGLSFSHRHDRLFCHGENLAVDLLRVRDDDIPGLLAGGSCDLGIVGLNVLEETRLSQPQAAQLQVLRPLGFARCRLALALPQEIKWTGPAQLEGRRIATSYPGLLQRWLDAKGLKACVVVLAGSVEIAPELGSADLICDLVESGATLAANQLREVETILDSQAVLAAPGCLPAGTRGRVLATLLQRLDSVLSVDESRLILMQAPRSALGAITALLPGQPEPTVTPIEGQPERVALQAVCSQRIEWTELEAMRQAGAQAMLVVPLEKMLT